jgi:hypothetical protein
MLIHRVILDAYKWSTETMLFTALVAYTDEAKKSTNTFNSRGIDYVLE